ncbi:hypothetical protein OS493_000533 [Desmophyllum pertusum]|uniref:Uncharacterized protein n=1 Tax=Desmophyllum pertusum TaxID=174260 RepID=A0A9X0DBR6_9CNID|nr:hypothetical protein OS493_000533 [Desmophyllum pertusum]
MRQSLQHKETSTLHGAGVRLTHLNSEPHKLAMKLEEEREFMKKPGPLPSYAATTLGKAFFKLNQQERERASTISTLKHGLFNERSFTVSVKYFKTALASFLVLTDVATGRIIRKPKTSTMSCTLPVGFQISLEFQQQITFQLLCFAHQFWSLVWFMLADLAR